MLIAIFHIVAVMISWWFVFNMIYRVVVAKVEVYYKPEEIVIDDIYTLIAGLGLLSFLWLAPMILA